jgi:uncharacterized protein YbjT (DUF2867 family)
MILVTGATGTNGRELIRELLARGEAVTAAVRNPERADVPAGVGKVRMEFGDPASIRAALEGADRLFLLAPDPGAEAPVVAAARAAGVKRLVKLSVWKADQESFTFARWHRASERAIEASGVPYVFLRPTGFQQNIVNHLAGSIRATGTFHAPAGDARVAHVDVRDIARVAAAVLTTDGHDGKAYDLSGPAAVSYGEIAATLSRALGKEIRYVDPGEDAWKKTMLGYGVPEAYADALVDLNRMYRSGFSEEVTPHVEVITGRKPGSIERYLEENVAAFRA